MTVTVHTDIDTVTSALFETRSEHTKYIIAQQVKNDTEKYVPFLTGSLQNRATIEPHDHLSDRVYVEENKIVYPGPYARYLYRGKVMVDAATGKGPMRIVDKLGNEYIRFHKGAKLTETDRPLKYSTEFHPKAGPAWFERSKADNLPRWLTVAERAVNGLA